MGKANLTLNRVRIKDGTLREVSTDLEMQLDLSFTSASLHNPTVVSLLPSVSQTLQTW